MTVLNVIVISIILCDGLLLMIKITPETQLHNYP
jgi:hypothetical protein